MTLLGRNIIVSTALAISDLFSFMISLYLSLNIFSMIITDYDKYVGDAANLLI